MLGRAGGRGAHIVLGLLGDRLPDALLLWGWASRCPCHRFEPTRDREREVEAAGETSGGQRLCTRSVGKGTTHTDGGDRAPRVM